MCELWRLLALSTILTSTSLCAAEDEENPFAIPVEEGMGVEFYDNGATRFAIFIQKATWEESKRLCNSRGGALLEYLDEGVPAFMGRALAESAVGFNSLWIGGQFTPGSQAGEDGVWKWFHSGSTIQATFPSGQEFPMTSPPYWVDRPNLKGPTELCLATDRNMHHHALIVAEPCHKERPYICSIPSGNNTRAGGIGSQVSPSVTVGQKNYHIYLDFVTWEEALKACREQGMKLAVVTKPFEFEILKNRLQRTRPIVENAWIGGANVYKKWVWIDTFETINTNPAKNDPKMPFPWFRDDIILDGCLLVDRHVCERLVYLEARCDRRRNYICESIQEEKNKLLPPLTEVAGYGSSYYISNYEETWHKANNICKVCLDGGSLLTIEKTQEKVLTQLPMLYKAMALTLKAELRHIWIGGYLYGSKFKWSHDENADPGDEVALSAADFQTVYGDGEKGIITYCEEDLMAESYLMEYKCLNLDRENQKHFMIYGTRCHYKQHYICAAPPTSTLEEFCKVVGNLSPPGKTLSSNPAKTNPETSS